MLGCGDCDRCRDGRQHLCAQRYEVGVRGGFPGALAEQLAVPASSLHALPDAVDAVAGAMVEPGGNALRAARAAGLEPGDRALVIGPGTIGLLAAEFLRAQGVEVHLAGQTDASIDFARRLGFERVARIDELTDDRFDAVIDASNAATVPALAVDLVEPGKRVVYIGIAGTPSLIDTRECVLKDVTTVGILSGSAGLSGAIEAYAAGAWTRDHSSRRPSGWRRSPTCSPVGGPPTPGQAPRCTWIPNADPSRSRRRRGGPDDHRHRADIAGSCATEWPTTDFSRRRTSVTPCRAADMARPRPALWGDAPRICPRVRGHFETLLPRPYPSSGAGAPKSLTARVLAIASNLATGHTVLRWHPRGLRSVRYRARDIGRRLCGRAVTRRARPGCGRSRPPHTPTASRPAA